MPTITRTYSVEYGSTIIGGSSDKFLLRKRGFGIFESYRTAKIMFEVVVYGATTTAFKDNNIELLDAFRTPRARLQVKTPDGLRDYNPSSSINTGFNAEPEIDVVGGKQNGPRFRNYRCSITVQLPADLTGQAGRRDNTDSLEKAPNRRSTYNFAGEYTALLTNDATAQYTANIATYTTAQLPSGDWQLLTEKTKVDDTDKVLTFSRVFKEITANQSVGLADNTSVVEQFLNVNKIDSGGSNSYVNNIPTKPMSAYGIEYRAVIDLEVTTASGLAALYSGTLRPHIINEITNTLGQAPSSSSIDNEWVDYDLDNNEIKASFTYRALNGSEVIESKMSKQIVDSTGLVHTPISTGRPHEYAKDDGPPERILRVMVMEKRKSGKFFEYIPPKNYDLLTEDTTGVEEVEGKFPDILKFKRRTKIWEYKFAILYSGGGGGGLRSQSGALLKDIANYNGSGL